jgi:enterochelin esterase-like enzyme
MKLRLNIPDWATHIVSDLTDMDRNPHPVDASKVRSFTLELPDDVYFEYAFLDAQGAMRADPENARRAENPWYREVSAVTGPAYRPDVCAEPEPLPLGETRRLRLESQRLAQTRRVSLYTPRGSEGEALPVVYVQDGVAFYRYAKLHLVLEHLLREQRARPAHLAFIEPVDRTQEYGFNEAYRAFVRDEVIPEVEGAVAATGERVALGASLGGLVSTLLALDDPERFRTVVAFSGAFLGTPADRRFYASESSWVLAELRARKRLPLRFYTETGTLEWLREVNREVASVLRDKGYEHRYVERNAGHNWTNWKNGLGGALSFALERPEDPRAGCARQVTAERPPAHRGRDAPRSRYGG